MELVGDDYLFESIIEGFLTSITKHNRYTIKSLNKENVRFYSDSKEYIVKLKNVNVEWFDWSLYEIVNGNHVIMESGSYLTLLDDEQE